VSPRTLLDKLWRRHLVSECPDGSGLLYIDRLLVYEVMSPQAFEGMRSASRPAWRSQSVLATVDLRDLMSI
jgi:3-isopropylmalate/(R)-2-methylmalate dehydratase large subunit